jgi:DNA-directed RNA polymerase subunit alpha
VEPFERGFGTTIGNSLRRILLSSLEGAAVTHVRIDGADHEFTTLPGVVEDVTVIILNVKSLIVRLSGDAPKSMRVSVQGRSGQSVQVRAQDIEADSAIEILNEEQLLATLTDDVEFKMEMTVGRGRSYATAEENKPEGDQIIGLIPVDSVYSPVTRVRYRVEDTRVGQRTNYDRLIMEIWTNGTITPEMALVEAAKILRKHLNTFVQYFEIGSGLALDGAGKEQACAMTQAAPPDDSVLNMPISSLDLSCRASNCLASADISMVGQLIQWDEAGLLKIRSFGKTTLREVKRKLGDLGLSLRSDAALPSADNQVKTMPGDVDLGMEETPDVDEDARMSGEPSAGEDLASFPPVLPPTPAPSHAVETPANSGMGTTNENTG